MDVKVFKTFLEVAQTRHFGRAAQNLYVTQAAVSARIRQLESFFDTDLFVRHRNNIGLTPAGERLIPYAEIMVRTLEQAKTDLALSEDKALQLTIAGTPNIWDVYLQNSLSVITSAFQGYAFRAESLSRDQLSQTLRQRTLDMALTFDPLKSEELVARQIAELELVMVSTESIELKQALSQDYVYVDWGTRFSAEHGERHPGTPPPLMHTSTGRIALDFILEKGGSAYLPQPMVAPFLDGGQLYRVQGVDSWPRHIYLNYHHASANLEAISRVRLLLDQTQPESTFSLQTLAEKM